MAIQDTDTFLVARGTANYQVAGSVLKAYAGGSGTQPSIPDVAAAPYGTTYLDRLYGVSYNPVTGYHYVYTNAIGLNPNDITGRVYGLSVLVSEDGVNFNLSGELDSNGNSAYPGTGQCISTPDTGANVIILRNSSATTVTSRTNPSFQSSVTPTSFANAVSFGSNYNVTQTSNVAYYDAGNLLSFITYDFGGGGTTYDTYCSTSTTEGLSWNTSMIFSASTSSGENPRSYAARGYVSAYVFTQTSLYKTTDGGFTFTKNSTPLPGGGSAVQWGAAGAVGTGNLLCGITNPSYAVYYSTDDGLTWNTSSGLPANTYRRKVLYSDLADKYIVFCDPYDSGSTPVSGGGACYVSTDGTGASFRLAAPGNPWLQAALGYGYALAPEVAINFGTNLFFIPSPVAGLNGYLCQVDPTTL